jgi:hypothetical protein
LTKECLQPDDFIPKMCALGLLTAVEGEHDPQSFGDPDISPSQVFVHCDQPVGEVTLEGAVFRPEGRKLLGHLLKFLAVAVGLVFVLIETFGQVLRYPPT